jgi:hypothetical protein
MSAPTLLSFSCHVGLLAITIKEILEPFFRPLEVWVWVLVGVFRYSAILVVHLSRDSGDDLSHLLEAADEG